MLAKFPCFFLSESKGIVCLNIALHHIRLPIVIPKNLFINKVCCQVNVRQKSPNRQAEWDFIE
jgi:hypothetical protein